MDTNKEKAVQSKSSFLKDVVKVAVSNVAKLLAGVLAGFLLPKMMGVNDYGMYKSFTLYATYVGLFQIGFADGIYLKYGGKTYENLNKSSFRLYTRVFWLIELGVSLISLIVGLAFFSGEYRFIIAWLSLCLFTTNIICYYQMISQITSRFSELSFRNIIQSLLTSTAIIALFIIHMIAKNDISYKVYVIIYNSINVLLLVWYVFTYRDILFGKKSAEKKEENISLRGIFLSGLPLMVANLCSTFILTIDRQFVNVLFETDVYAVYAFAYNLLSLITIALSAISVVLYPSLKKSNKDSLRDNYSNLVSAILILVFFCLLSYFPLCWFIEWFLPKYCNALPIFRIILPGLAISSSVTVVMHNYYKTLGKNLEFFIKSVVILVLSFIANLVAYSIFKTTISISVASVFVMVVWYLICEERFVKEYKVRWFKNFMYLVIVSCGFYCTTLYNNTWSALLVYALLFASTTFAFHPELLFVFLKRGRKSIEPKQSKLRQTNLIDSNENCKVNS